MCGARRAMCIKSSVFFFLARVTVYRIGTIINKNIILIPRHTHTHTCTYMLAKQSFASSNIVNTHFSPKRFKNRFSSYSAQKHTDEMRLFFHSEISPSVRGNRPKMENSKTSVKKNKKKQKALANENSQKIKVNTRS